MDISALFDRLSLSVSDSGFLSVSLSKPVDREACILKERWVPLSGAIKAEQFSEKQAFHRSIPESGLRSAFESSFSGYAQALVRFSDCEVQCLRSKSGKVSLVVNRSPGKVPGKDAGDKALTDGAHDRKKQYLLSVDRPLPFLVGLGIQSKEGKVLADRQAKFRQICRFVELVDSLDAGRLVGTGRPLSVVDFGCGKAYLSFALYHFLSVERSMDVRMLGLDTKGDVVEFCNDLARSSGFGGLSFRNADIASWDAGEGVDLAISLHACDTATDIALAKAATAGAGAIMSVPCCQHELSTQLDCDALRLMSRYGIIKERFSSLATDSLRSSLMRLAGYSVDMIEFVDPEHSPKNIMLRCVRNRAGLSGIEADSRLRAEREREWVEYRALRDLLGVTPTLEGLLGDAGLLPKG